MTRPATSSVERLAEEYRALRDAAAVVDLTGWAILELTGPETREFLQGTATQDFGTPPAPGTASRTLFLTEKGRPVAHAWVAFGGAADEPRAAWILADPGAGPGLRMHLERFRVMEDVEFRGPEGMPVLYGVAGPERDPLAQAIASKTEGALAIRGEPLSFVLLPPDGGPDAPPAAAPPTVDPRAFEAWRIRAGLPFQGIDFDLDRIATELTLPEAISMSKGCYVGQEVVARTAHRGKLRRQRAGFRFPWSGEPIPKGTELRSGGLEAGHVTSAAWEPGTNEGLGMGYITPDALAMKLDVLAVQGEKTMLLSLHSWPL
ncbi:MAG TPA: glycine cleavage T C-terminal barrel domain-containing protein [Candidatus Angelobacter sp.]|nr:glycine cleavage T C-terminal barrel domain-containing protein [Candidatus Angelobacter sp.]